MNVSAIDISSALLISIDSIQILSKTSNIQTQFYVNE